MGRERWDRERLQILSSLLVTVLLLAFAAGLVIFVPGSNADTLGSVIITAVVAKWLQAETRQDAERSAEKLQDAVAGAKNGEK